jgi:hypothetical protein
MTGCPNAVLFQDLVNSKREDLGFDVIALADSGQTGQTS